MSTRALAVLEQIRALPPEEMRELQQQINRLAEKPETPAFKTRQGFPQSRNDGVKMTAHEVAATLNDG